MQTVEIRNVMTKILLIALLFMGLNIQSIKAHAQCSVSAAGLFDAAIRAEPCEGEGCESVGEVNLTMNLSLDGNGTVSGFFRTGRTGLNDRNVFQVAIVRVKGPMDGDCVVGENFHIEAIGQGLFKIEQAFGGGPAIHAQARFNVDVPGEDGADLKLTFLFDDGSSFVQNLSLRTGHFDGP